MNHITRLEGHKFSIPLTDGWFGCECGVAVESKKYMEKLNTVVEFVREDDRFKQYFPNRRGEISNNRKAPSRGGCDGG